MADAKRELLLRVHRHRLRREDLEDAYSQATVELIAQARRGARFSSRLHLGHTLEQRFLSRIYDRRRALSGRSPMQAAIETAMPLDCAEREQVDMVDLRAELETLVILREDLRRVRMLADALSADQRLVLASQLSLQLERRRFLPAPSLDTREVPKGGAARAGTLEAADGGRRAVCPIFGAGVGRGDRDHL